MTGSYLVLEPFGRYVAGQFADLSDVQARTYARKIAARTAFVPAIPPPATAASLGAALAALDAATQAREAAGILFQAQGAATASLMPTDIASQGKLLSAFVAAGAGLWQDGTPWKMSDGTTFVPFTAADVQVAAGHALGYVAGCAASQARIAQVLKSDPAYDYSAATNWPSQGPFSTKATLAPKADAVRFDTLFATPSR